MKKFQRFILIGLVLLGSRSFAFGQGTIFTYQGYLTDQGAPADGDYDLRIAFFDAGTNGNQIGCAATNAPVAIRHGLFTLTLDKGGDVFTGGTRWLEIGVRSHGSDGEFILLSPRQRVTATPYAITAANVVGAIPDTGLTGTYSSALNFTNNANQFSGRFAGAFIGSGAGLTNLPMAAGASVTNECIISAKDNTNVLYLTGAGTMAANGEYYWNALEALTNATGCGICFDCDLGIWLLTNAASLYQNNSAYGPAGPWQDSGSHDALPAGSWGTNYETNCFTRELVSAQIKADNLEGTNLLFVNASAGNDLVALRGDRGRPFATIKGALQVARPNDIVVVGPGRYGSEVGRLGYNIPSGVSLVGFGAGISWIDFGFTNAAAIGFAVHNHSILASFSTYGVPTITGTNVVLQDLEVIGASDGVYLAEWGTPVDIIRCRLSSLYDSIADWDMRPGAAARLLRVFDTHCRAHYEDPPGFSVIHAFSGSQSHYEFYGGSLRAENGNAACFQLTGDSGRPTGGSLRISGTALFCASTNGTADLFVSTNVPVMSNSTIGNFIGNFSGNGAGITNLAALSSIRVATTIVATNGVASFASNGLGLASIGVGASPFNWTNTAAANVFVFLSGGKGTNVSINGKTVFSSLSGAETIPLQPGEWMSVSYTTAPTIRYKPF